MVVGVDSPTARLAVHGSMVPWLDLRCIGDSFIALDSRMGEESISSLTNEMQPSGSCQMEGAIEAGNIQFGHLAAAAHGAQWVVQWLRDSTCPPGRIYSTYMGELPFPEVTD